METSEPLLTWREPVLEMHETDGTYSFGPVLSDETSRRKADLRSVHREAGFVALVLAVMIAADMMLGWSGLTSGFIVTVYAVAYMGYWGVIFGWAAMHTLRRKEAMETGDVIVYDKSMTRV